MTTRTHLCILIGALAPVVLAAPARGDDRAKLTEDLVYTTVGDRELKLDLAEPTGADGPFPGIVVIHSGAWRQGDKKEVRPLLPELARRGYVAISPQHRFCPKDPFPAQVHDVKVAVRWLRAHAKQYRLDADHIGAWGFSSGGHLALMLGLTGPEDGLEGDVPGGAPSSKVQAVVNWFGPTDLAAPDYLAVSQEHIRDLLGGTPAEKPEAYRKASPVTFVTKDDGPVLTFHGTRDPLVPYPQAIKLADAMTKSGVPGRVELLVGAGHAWLDDLLLVKHTLDETYAFFDEHLKPNH